MTRELEQLVTETIDLTGAEAPRVLDADAPVLVADQPLDARATYIVGLIGGKDVGKSSLVNALVGREITEPTSYGPGTEAVIAYAHTSVASELRDRLDREVPEQFRIVTHDERGLERQVLLDLPDIDSRFTDHVQLTRRMLRHMLYPVWIQSIEKYADQQPQRLLAMVAEGNDPENFVFVLNKVDQLLAREGAAAVEQLKEDFATRIARTLDLPAPPRVYAISATRPEIGDFRELRHLLARQRSTEAVRDARQLAVRRQDRSLLTWLDNQQLPQRAAMLGRIEREAEELLAERVARPILEQAIPRLLADPGHRMSLLEPALHKRLSRWPVVNVIDAMLAPVLALVRKNISATPASAGVDLEAYLQSAGRSVPSLIQGSFAQLHRTNPLVASLYANRKLWDDLPVEAASVDLRQRLEATIARQREAIADRVAGRYGIIRPLLRWLLTIGAIVWFPFAQPVLEVLLAGGLTASTIEVARLVVSLLGVTYLLKNVTFLLIWFIALWAILRWDTQRRVERFVNRWNARATLDDPLSLTGTVLHWLDELIEPIRARRQRVESLVEQVESLRSLAA